MRRLFLLLGLAVVGAVLIIGSTHAEVQENEKCCFTHPSYTGTCEVTPGEDESCGNILRYLNTPNSMGKTYCGGSELRGGWSLASCEEP